MVFAAAPGQAPRRIEKEEDRESGQTGECENADRQLETQSTDSGDDERSERMQAIANLFQSLLKSLTGGEQGESGPSNDAGSSPQSATGGSARLCCDDSRSPVNRSMYIHASIWSWSALFVRETVVCIFVRLWRG